MAKRNTPLKDELISSADELPLMLAQAISLIKHIDRGIQTLQNQSIDKNELAIDVAQSAQLAVAELLEERQRKFEKEREQQNGKTPEQYFEELSAMYEDIITKCKAFYECYLRVGKTFEELRDIQKTNLEQFAKLSDKTDKLVVALSEKPVANAATDSSEKQPTRSPMKPYRFWRRLGLLCLVFTLILSIVMTVLLALDNSTLRQINGIYRERVENVRSMGR